MKRRHLLAAALGAGLTAACSSNDPLANPSTKASSSTSASASTGGTLVVGSQAYYSNEIIAECYSQSLEAAGFTIDRQFKIGQREAYIPEITAGKIDLFPEYTGPLLQFWKPDTKARLADPVYTELKAAVPSGLMVLDQSPATDQDSYVVTNEFATKWSLTSIEDLSKVTDKMTMGAQAEAETRPNGPKGLKSVYGIDVGFTPIQDSGGPLTVKALKDNKIQLAIIYTADPSIATNNLVSLTDPKGLFLASHVVPLASTKVNDAAAAIVNKVSTTMSPTDLIEMNSQSVNEKRSAADIAKEWLANAGI